MAIVPDLSGNGFTGVEDHIPTPGGSGGGSGDANAANQVLANTKLDTLHVDLQALINGTSTINISDDISVIFYGTTAYTVQRGAIDCGAATSQDLVAAQGAGKKVYLLSYSFVSVGAGTVQWFSGTGPTALTGAMPVAANGGIADNANTGVVVTGANEKLTITTTSAATARGRAAWIIV